MLKNPVLKNKVQSVWKKSVISGVLASMSLTLAPLTTHAGPTGATGGGRPVEPGRSAEKSDKERAETPEQRETRQRMTLERMIVEQNRMRAVAVGGKLGIGRWRVERILDRLLEKYGDLEAAVFIDLMDRANAGQTYRAREILEKSVELFERSTDTAEAPGSYINGIRFTNVLRESQSMTEREIDNMITALNGFIAERLSNPVDTREFERLAAKGDVAGMTRMVEADRTLIHRANTIPALVAAVEAGSRVLGARETVEYLLERGVKVIGIKSEQGEYLLEMALKQKDRPMVELLATYLGRELTEDAILSQMGLQKSPKSKDTDYLAQMALIDQVAVFLGSPGKGKAGEAAGEKAAKYSQNEIAARRAVERGEVSSLERLFGETPELKDSSEIARSLLTVIEAGHVPTVKFLLQAGVNPNAVRNTNGETALILATKYRQTEIVQALLDAKADVNAYDHQGKTALDCAQGTSIRESQIRTRLERAAERQPESRVHFMRRWATRFGLGGDREGSD